MKIFKIKPFTIVSIMIVGSLLFMNPASAVVIIKSGNVEYCTHVQNEGWQTWKDEGEKSGTSGQSLRLKGIEIKVTNLPDKTHQVGIRYKTHVENIGWQDWVADGIMSGTEGKGYRLEAIQIELTGADADKYDVYYRVHAQNIGWLGWSKDGASSGTAGYGYRLYINYIANRRSKSSGESCLMISTLYIPIVDTMGFTVNSINHDNKNLEKDLQKRMRVESKYVII